MIDESCVHCPRSCPRCGYAIRGGFEHIERPQPAGSNVVVCGLRRVSRPVGEAISLYLDHAQHESVIQ